MSWLRSRTKDPYNILYFIAVDPIIVIADFAVRNEETLAEDLKQSSFTAIGLIASIGFYVLLKEGLRKLGLVRYSPWPVIGLFGMSIGYMVQLVEENMTLLDQGNPPAVTAPEFFGLFFGMILAIAVALLMEAQESYNETRIQLVAKRVRDFNDQKLITAPEISEFIEHAKIRLLQDKSTSGKDLSETIRELVDSKLRPVSHALWASETRKLKRFSTRRLLTKAITAPPAYPLMIGGFAVLTSYRYTFGYLGVELGSLRLLSLFLVILIAIWVQRIIYEKFIGFWRNKPNLIIGLLAMTTLVSILPDSIFGSPDNQVFWRFFLIALSILGIASISANLISETRKFIKTRKNLEDELIENDQDRELELFLNSIRAKEDADFLHGYIQNRLLAVAAEFESQPEGLTNERGLRLVLKILDEAATPARRTGLGLDSDLAAIKKSWQGLLDIDYSTNLDEEITGIRAELLGLCIREAVTNSYRHGKATKVDISIIDEEEQIVLRITDDGAGLVDYKSGLGKNLFDATGDYRLRNLHNGGAELTISCKKTTRENPE